MGSIDEKSRLEGIKAAILRHDYFARDPGGVGGVLSVVAGVGWLTFLYPPLGYRLFFYIAPLGLLGAACRAPARTW